MGEEQTKNALSLSAWLLCLYAARSRSCPCLVASVGAHSQVILESAALGQAARLAETCRNWLRESHLSPFTVVQLLQQNELREAASQSLVTSPSSSSASASPPPAADSAEQRMHAAVQYLFRMGIILRSVTALMSHHCISVRSEALTHSLGFAMALLFFLLLFPPLRIDFCSPKSDVDTYERE